MERARILIVEDEVLVAANLEAMLQDLGYEPVGIAPDTATAMELAQYKPDLALVDINLRDGETGPIIAERLAREYGVLVLFVTANPRIVETATTPAIGVLSKPCDDTVIETAIAYALMARHNAHLPAPPAGLTLLNTPA
jgi:two-component system, response regulator PdtaR